MRSSCQSLLLGANCDNEEEEAEAARTILGGAVMGGTADRGRVRPLVVVVVPPLLPAPPLLGAVLTGVLRGVVLAGRGAVTAGMARRWWTGRYLVVLVGCSNVRFAACSCNLLLVDGCEARHGSVLCGNVPVDGWFGRGRYGDI